MSETCYKHALNMPITTTCPQCEIADLKQQLAAIRKDTAREIVEIVKYRKAFWRHAIIDIKNKYGLED